MEGNVIESKNGITKIIVGSFLIELLGNHDIGTMVGVLIRPEDMILSMDKVKTSARNIIKARVVNITRTRKSFIWYLGLQMILGFILELKKVITYLPCLKRHPLKSSVKRNIPLQIIIDDNFIIQNIIRYQVETNSKNLPKFNHRRSLFLSNNSRIINKSGFS